MLGVNSALLPLSTDPQTVAGSPMKQGLPRHAAHRLPLCTMRLHIRPQQRVDPRLVATAPAFEPRQDIAVDAQRQLRLRRHRLESPAHHGPGEHLRADFRSVAQINGAVGEGVDACPVGPRLG